jgi:hypothetical protein
MFTEFKPFVVEPDGPEKKVILRNPDDDKDFIVVYRSVSWEDTIGICSRLNSIMNVHNTRHRTMDSLRSREDRLLSLGFMDPDVHPDVYCDDDRDTIPGGHE